MRLIDVDSLDILGYLEEFPVGESDKAWNAAIREVFAYVNLAPAIDAVPVVRCRDCKHCEFKEFKNAVCWRRNNLVATEDFCSYGEKREEET